MLDRLTGMRVFVRAQSTGSLSGAARELDMSPAMAIKHVDALEAHLGVKLMHRTTRRLSLTDVGRQYLDACLRILPEIEEAEARAASQRVQVSGLLRMSTPLSFGVRYVAPLLAQFAERHADVKVELGLSDSYLDLLDGGWDMSIRIGRLADSPLQARKLADGAMILCAAPAYLAHHGTPARTRDLAVHNCLGYTLSLSSGSHEWLFGRQGETRVPIQGNLVANNGDALLAAAVAGQGVIYQPEFIVGAALQSGELVNIELAQTQTTPISIYAVYPPDRSPPAKVRAMIDFLVEAFAGKWPWQASAGKRA